MLRCSELGLTRAEDLDQYSEANDREKYAIKPKPGGLRAFFAGGGKIAQ